MSKACPRGGEVAGKRRNRPCGDPGADRDSGGWCACRVLPLQNPPAALLRRMGCSQSTESKPPGHGSHGLRAGAYARAKVAYIDSVLAEEAPDVHAAYTVRDVIGEGTAGVVLACTRRATGERVAVKYADKRGEAWVAACVASERLAAGRLRDHPNLARIEACLVRGRVALTVMERAPGRALRVAAGGYDRSTVRAVVTALLRGVGHMHECGVAHMDVKLENVVVADGAGAALQPAQVKLVDFGSVAECGGGATTTTLAGTPAYAAPEVLHALLLATSARSGGAPVGVDGAKTDVWSIGIVAALLRTGRHPFAPEGVPADLAAYVKAVGGGVPMGRRVADGHDPDADAALDAFLARALCVDAHTRATVGELLQHPFVVGENVDPPQPPAEQFRRTDTGATYATAQDTTACALDALDVSFASATGIGEVDSFCAPPALCRTRPF